MKLAQTFLLSCSVILTFLPSHILLAKSIEEELSVEDPAALAQAARKNGRAKKGAIVFYQPQLTCVKCHVAGEREETLGPDLTQLDKSLDDVYLVESILHPSKVIKKNFEPISIVTTDGRTINGLLVADEADKLVLRDAAQDFEAVSISKTNIEERFVSPVSIMPEKLVSMIGNRRQFLDLIRYLIEIRDGGLARAKELEPKVKPMGPPIATEKIDHAGIISRWGKSNFDNGKRIFEGLCINCHGPDGKAVSLPIARAFGSQELKFGADPYKMYLTLTNGNGLMGPMTYLVPKERYDVIYYIREAFMKGSNPQYSAVDPQYLNSLPIGTSLGEAPPSVDRDFGPALASQLDRRVVSALTVKLGTMTICYNLHTMDQADVWSGGFLNLDATQHMRSRGEGTPEPDGEIIDGLKGWQWGHDGTLEYPKDDLLPRGPLPERWLDYKGHYLYGDRLVLSYQIDGRPILELPQQEQGLAAVSHTLKIGPGQSLVLGVAQCDADGDRIEGIIPAGAASPTAREGTARETVCLTGVRVDRELGRFTAAAVLGNSNGLVWSVNHRHQLVLHVPADTRPRLIQVVRFAAEGSDALDTFRAVLGIKKQNAIVNPETMTHGGPLRWADVLTTQGTLGNEDKAYALDTLTRPKSTPWNTWFRTTALDFFSDGRMALCTHGGDVWIVSRIDDTLKELQWKRFAGGLYEAMGVRVVNDVVYVTCKDRITRLHDFNHDDEADFYESFSADTDVSLFFHSFNFDLQTDSKGNFYYSKCGQYTDYALPGAVIKVSPDGKHREVYCTGFRVPNGMGIMNDDRLTASDNQGNWMPASKVMILKRGGFYGYSQTHTAGPGNWEPDGGRIDPKKVVPPKTFDQPVIWMPQDFDNSSGGQVWIDDKRFGPLAGRLFHTSFGKGWLYYLMIQDVGDISQAAIVKLPYDFSTGIMRARVNPKDGQVYATGLNGWNGSGRKGLVDGGVQRLRYTGKPLMMVSDCRVETNGLRLSFNFPLDNASIQKKDAFRIEEWNYLWSPNYGSKMYSVRTGQEGRDRVEIHRVSLSADGKSVKLEIPDIKPVNQVFIELAVQSCASEPFHEEVYLTINRVPDTTE